MVPLTIRSQKYSKTQKARKDEETKAGKDFQALEIVAEEDHQGIPCCRN